MMKILLQYPEKNFELQIMDGQEKINSAQIQKVLNPADLEKTKSEVVQIHVDPKIKDYIYQIVETTRNPGESIKKYITYGVSPRGSIALYQAAKAMAYLQGRGYVTPSDVKVMAYDVLRHRLVLSYQAQADGRSADQILEQVLAQVIVP
jgi:MoxR-like ATPase